MVQETDVVREEINETRDQIAEKLVTLEGKIREQVESAKSKAEETIESVKTTVRHVTPRYQIETHPLAAVGVSAVAGALVGGMVKRRVARRRSEELRETEPPSGREAYAVRDTRVPIQGYETSPTPPRGAWLKKLGDYFSDEIQLVKGFALAGLAQGIGNLVKEPWPKLGPQVDQVVESVKRKGLGREG